MKFGVFDHLDNNGLPLGELFENRLKLAEAYERIGIHCYHIAEHHATPLGMSPSPSVFLSAVAQRTKTMLFGPLVYTLALYHPLRLAEEICMLDHLGGGRLQLGVGRGVSPIEMGFYGIDVARSQAMYMEAYAVVMKALTSATLTHEGEFYHFRDVPIQMQPLQQPHPPLWYGLGNPAGVEWVAENRFNVVSLAPARVVRTITDRYRAQWAVAGRDPARLPLLGAIRHVVIAESDDEAMEVARRAYRRWRASFWYLWIKYDAKPRFAPYPEEFDDLVASGQGVAGSPQTVRAALAAQVAEAGVNYLLLDLAFGDLSLEESLRSVELFAKHVKPEL